MAPKRNQPASVAEPPQSPKKRASLGLIGTRDVAKKGKRKIEALEIEVQEKAPKRTAAKATTRRASKVAEVDDVGHQPEVKETAVIKRVKATMGIMTNGKGVVEVAKPARVPRKGKAPDNVSEVAIEASSAPEVSSRPATVFHSIERKDGREFYIPVETSDDDAELTLLWQQFWSTIELCSVTVSPLFLVLVLSLYAASLVTNSQVIASIGLVYVFLFLTIMGSYFFAIVPFILASNTIGNILTPGGTGSGSSQKVSTRLFLLLLLMAVAAGSSKYGYLGF